MNKTEAQQRVDAAIKELEAAKAALEQAQESEGRVIMKPSEVPVGGYFRYVDETFDGGRTQLSLKHGQHVSIGGLPAAKDTFARDRYPVYLTDPYGNAIEPCENLPDHFNVGYAVSALSIDGAYLVDAFSWSAEKSGREFWAEQKRFGNLSPSAAAKLRGMIHKWNQENGGQG